MTGFVLDCSIAVAWCFEDEASDICDALLERVRDEGALVPSLWHLELGNVMIQAERRRRINSADVSTRLELIGDLPIVTDDETPQRALHEVLALARAENLTTYDAAYLELAIRRGLPLATNDKRLRNAGANTGVQVIPA
ncbi:type II toxin-antitoxin system VapC family toxin [Methyloglobulus sp.]|uniref:type II toxin-antitoxin system VapC family toxin n=1 Tax=Methyloglobulus sp. TaxID=2518622 RepID=UPI0039891B7D